MSLRKQMALTLMFLLTCIGIASVEKTVFGFGFGETPQGLPEPAFISAEELKAKLEKNQPVTVIDVRGSSSVLESDSKIKGAVYVKLRRLKYRLGFPPLKDVSRNSEVVTYCACPNDESSVRAAQVLRETGFKNVRVLKGGWVVWKKIKGQVEPMARG